VEGARKARILVVDDDSGHRLILKNVERIDTAEHVLTMGHYYFRHGEMEIFVTESQLPEAVALLREATDAFAASGRVGDAKAGQQPPASEAQRELLAHRGSYVHHYPALFRRVLPEDALVSMVASASEPWFSFSLFTYERPGKRNAYYGVCSWFARAMHALFGARLHWGKHYPLGAVETARMYPHLERFRQICRASDPAGVFRNDFTDSVLEQR
jgi:hypothetical protein